MFTFKDFLKEDINAYNDAVEWITTKYSTVDSMNGEEKFAELFAVTHWEEQYSEYSRQMEKFKKTIQ